MSGKKTWVKIDDDLPFNRKVLSVSEGARWLYVAGICYAGHNKTNGDLIPSDVEAIRGTKKAIAELERAVLWEVRPFGWYIHDYLLHNRSAEQMQTASQTARKNGGKGLASRYGFASDSANDSASNPVGYARSVLSAPLESGDLSPDLPEREQKTRSSKTPSQLLATRKTIPDDDWVEEMRQKHGSQLRDFNETLRFHAQGPYYKRLDDKQEFLEKKLVAAVERERQSRPVAAFANGSSMSPEWSPPNMISFGDDE